MRSRSNGISKEEKVALKISTMLSDLHLDLESIGFYVARVMPYQNYRRFLEIAESAEYQKETVEHNEINKYLERLF